MREKGARDPLTRTNESVAKPRGKNTDEKPTGCASQLLNLYQFCRRRKKEKNRTFHKCRNPFRRSPFDSKRILITVTILVEKNGVRRIVYLDPLRTTWSIRRSSKKKIASNSRIPRRFSNGNEWRERREGDKSIRIIPREKCYVNKNRLSFRFEFRSRTEAEWNSSALKFQIGREQTDRESVLANSILSFLSLSFSIDGFRLLEHGFSIRTANSSLLRLSSVWGRRVTRLVESGRSYVYFARNYRVFIFARIPAFNRRTRLFFSSSPFPSRG